MNDVPNTQSPPVTESSAVLTTPGTAPMPVGGSDSPVDRPRRTPIVVSAVLYGMIVACVGILVGADIAREWQGATALLLMLALLGLRVPVGVAMIIASLIGMYSIAGWHLVPNTLRTMPFLAVASWSLSVMPMFILMGLLLWRSGTTDRVYDFTRVWFNWMPGGLAITTNVAGAGLAAVSGSTMGITYALGRLSIPEMLRNGYDPRMATGAVIMAGTGGQLIPPSVLLVLYAGIAGTPIGPQLLSGILPGIILAFGICVTIMIIAKLKPSIAPPPARELVPFREKLKISVRVWPVAILMTIVVGGIFTGIFTATEAGAYGALGAVIVTLVNDRSRNGVNKIKQSVIETATATGGIMVLLIGAYLITRMLSLSGLSLRFSELITNLNLGRFWILIVLLLAYLVLGMVLDPLTMMLLTVPLLLPILGPLDVSAIWFGVFIVLLGEIAIVTPPVGVLSYVVHKVASSPDVNQGVKISLAQVFTGALWFLPVAILVGVLIIVFPALAEWLPAISAAQ